jgi:hypothetical protein
MVIESFDTFVASAAMFASILYTHITYLTIILIQMLILERFVESSALNLYRYQLIFWIDCSCPGPVHKDKNESDETYKAEYNCYIVYLPI